eukprot:scaffold286495_cov19-Prasinocladus_malaysianus.AAC.1
MMSRPPAIQTFMSLTECVFCNFIVKKGVLQGVEQGAQARRGAALHSLAGQAIDTYISASSAKPACYTLSASAFFGLIAFITLSADDSSSNFILFSFTIAHAPPANQGMGICIEAVKQCGDPHVPLPPGPAFFQYADPQVSAKHLTDAGLNDIDSSEVRMSALTRQT